MVSIGRLVFKATGVMSNKGVVKNTNKIGNAIVEKMRLSGGNIENAEVQKIISDTIGKKAARKIKIIESLDEVKHFLLKQGRKTEDVKEALDKAGAFTSGENYKRQSIIFVNDDSFKLLSGENPELLSFMRVNSLVHEIQHALSGTFGYLSLPKLKGKFAFGRKMIDKDIEKMLKSELQSKYVKLQMECLEKMGKGESFGNNDIIKLLYSKGILTPNKDKENAYILKSLKNVFADEVRSYTVGFEAACKYSGLDAYPDFVKNIISVFKNLSEATGQELKHIRRNQIKRFFGINHDIS